MPYADPEVQRAYVQRWTADNKERNRESIRRSHLKSRERMLNAYGGKCACCGEATPQFLGVDHIFNDGAVDRKAGITGSRLYYKMQREGYPKDRYQLLCHNCNLAKGIYGACPHQVVESSTCLIPSPTNP